MAYLLDTNACIALINGSPSSVRGRFSKAIHNGAEIYTSSIVLFELWYGVEKSSRPQANAERIAMFLSGPVGMLPFDETDAHAAGAVRVTLEGMGKPIGAYDVLIAGQALARKMTLVTCNLREFSRVKGLAWEDWAKE